MTVLEIKPTRTAADGGIPAWLANNILFYKEQVERIRREQEATTSHVNEVLYYTICALVLGLSAIVVGCTIKFVPSIILFFGLVPISPHIFIYLLIGVYLLAGIRSVGTDEIAGADFGGTPAHQFGAGYKWVPWLIFNFFKERATFVQAQLPGDADKIFWGEEKTDLPPGMVRPIRALFDEKPNGALPTETQMSAGVVLLVKGRQTASRLFDFVKKIGPIDEQSKKVIKNTITGAADLSDQMYEVVRNIRDTGEAVIIELAGQMSYSEMNSNLFQVNELLQLRLHMAVAEWGFQMEEVKITAINPGHDFNKKIQDRADAKADSDVLTYKAKGEADRIIKVGEANAKAELARLKAIGDGYADIATKTGVDGQTVVAAETIKTLAAAGNVVVADGIGGLMGIIKAATKPKGTP